MAGSVLGLRSLTGGGADPATPAEPPSADGPAIDPDPTSSSVPRDSRFPPRNVEGSPDRLAPVVAPPAGSGGFVVTSRSATGAPVAYDPCRPIHYVVRPDGAPSGGGRLVREAMAELGAATGLVFVDDGDTDEAPGQRAPYQPERYGQRWAPVLIAWSTPTETPELAGTTTGTGGSQQVTVTGNGASETAYVTGSVVLDAPQLRGAGSRAARAVLAHELGHVVGLNHVDDRSQLMYRESGLGISTYQDGDRRGLAQVGAGPCTPML